MDSLKKQIGGDHYQKRAIQPIEYILDNDLNFCEGCVVKYVTRWRDKGGVEDLEKAMHYLQFLIEEQKQAIAFKHSRGSVSNYTAHQDDPGDSQPGTKFEWREPEALVRALSDEKAYPTNKYPEGYDK